MTKQSRFELPAPFEVPNTQLSALRLSRQIGTLPGVEAEDGGVRFHRAGWFEIVLTVAWEPTVRHGRRFAHTAVPHQHPLHSEAIEAGVLAELSQGRQLLRGSSVFGPGSIDRVVLEVWQDSGTSVSVPHASLEVRLLPGTDKLDETSPPSAG